MLSLIIWLFCVGITIIVALFVVRMVIGIVAMLIAGVIFGAAELKKRLFR